MANALSGADISLFVGLPVAGGLYLLLSRSLDVEREWKAADADARTRPTLDDEATEVTA